MPQIQETHLQLLVSQPEKKLALCYSM
jgi:hypothetical protein